MNIAKHMEAIAIVAIVLLCTATAVASNQAQGSARAGQFANTAVSNAASNAIVAPLAAADAIPTITVSARRLTAAEKAALPL